MTGIRTVPDTDGTRQVERIVELGSLETISTGTIIRVAEDGYDYTCVGHIPDEITSHINWPAHQVWMPQHVISDVQSKRGWILLDPVAVASLVIQRPESAWKDTRSDNAVRFVVGADGIREHGLLNSVSTRYVDAIVELRKVPGGSVLRLFHLSPQTNEQKGTKLWP
jgi:hypothetical protein